MNEKSKSSSDNSREQILLLESEIHRLQNRLNRIDNIIGNSLDAVICTDLEGKVTLWNRGAVKLYGYTEEEMLQQPISIIYKEEDLPVLGSIISRLLNNEEIEDKEVTVIDKWKNNKTILLSLTTLKDREGNIIELVGFTKDVSEKEDTFKALQDSEARFRTLTESSPIGIYITDVNGDCTYANPFWLNMAGMQLEEALGDNWKQAIHPADRDTIAEKWYKSVQSKGTWGYEYRFQDKTGKETWVYGTANKIKNANNELIGYVGINQDITEQKRINEANRLHAYLLKAIEQAVIVTSLEGIISFWNPFAEKLYGWTEEEVLGRNIMDITVPQVSQEQGAEIMQKLKAGESWSGEFQVQHRNGNTFPIFVTDTPILNDQGELDGIIGVSIDISERKNAEEELLRTKLLLEDMGEMAKIGGWEVDIATMDGFFTKQTAEIYDMPGTTYLKTSEGMTYYPKESYPIIEKAVKDAIEKNIPYDLEVPFISAKGIKKWVRTQGQAYFEDGKPIRLYGSMQDISKRKALEESVQRSTKFQNDAQRLAKLGYWIWEIDAQNFTGNEVSYEMHDVPFGKVSMEELLERIHPDDSEHFVKKFNEWLSGEVNDDFEYRTIHRDGSVKYVHTTCKVERNNDGKIIRLLGSAQDITDRKVAENTLKESEDKFSKAFNNSPAPTQIVNLKTGERIAANDKFCEVFGFAREELEKGNVYTNNLAVDMNDFNQRTELLLQNGSLENVPYRMQTKSGDCLDLLVNADKLYAENNDVYIISYIDITEQKRTAQELAKYTERLLKAQEIGNIGTWNLDLVNDVLEWTEQNYKIFGVEQGKEMRLKDFFACIHPEDSDFVSEKWNAALKGDDYDIEHRLLVDGRVKWVREKADILFDPMLKPIKAIGITQDISERKAMEQERDRLDNILEEAGKQAKIGGWELDTLNNELIWTKQIFEIHELSQDEQPSLKDAINFYHPEDRKIISKVVEEALNEAKPWDVEIRLITAKGKHIWTRSMCEPFVVDGRVTKLYGTFQDITEQKKAKDKLVESEGRLRDVAENAPGIVYQFKIDKQGNQSFPFMSKNSKKLMGFAAEEIMKDANILTNAVHPEDQETFQNAVQESFSKIAPYHITHRMICKSGEIIWLNANATPRLQEDGSIIWTGVGIDASKQIRAEKALKESEEKFSIAFNNSPMPMSLINLVSGERLEVNDKFCEIFEYTKAEMSKRDVFTGNLARNQEDLDHAIKLGLDDKLIEYPFKMVTKTGRIKDMEISAVPLYPDNKEVYVTTYLDVTERKAAEKRLKLSEQSLKKIISATTGKRGQAYFESMAKVLEEVTASSYSFIGVNLENDSVRTLALSHQGSIRDNFTYDLVGTPCHDVIRSSSCIYPSQISRLFPDDQLLLDLKIEAYAGTPIFNSQKECVGILVSLYDKPLEDTVFIQTIFEVFASAIGAEMERLEYEKSFRSSEEKFSKAFNSSPIPMSIVDLSTGTRISVNEKFCQVTKYSEKELLHGNIYEALLVKSKDRLDRAVERSKKQGYLIDFPIEMVTKKGKIIDVLLNAVKVQIDDKEVFVISHMDITKQKLAEEQLAENERNIYRAIVSSEEQERERYAKELHDGLGPIISTSMIYLHTILDEKDRNKQEELINRTHELLGDATKSVREITNNLSPDVLKKYGLVQAVRSFIEKLVHVSDIKFKIKSKIKERFPEVVEITIYRSITELINNTIKHARAKKISIDIRYKEEYIYVNYSDDGVGFDLSKSNTGFGLLNIENRINKLDGVYTLESSKDEGTKVHLAIKTKHVSAGS